MRRKDRALGAVHGHARVQSARVKRPRRRLSFVRLLILLLLVLAVGTGSAFALRRAVDSGPATVAPPWFAPYVDVTITPRFNFEDPSANPAEEVVLGFVVADRAGTCTPTWGTYYDIESAARELDLDRRISRLRQRGGDVIVSFGGAANDELAVSCESDADLLAAYRAVIAHYEVTTIDFDIEGSSLSDTAASERRARVVKRLQASARADGDSLAVWLTLPVSPAGLPGEGVAVVDAMLSAGVDLSGVNVMAMDYGGSRDTSQTMADATKQAIEGTWRQLEAAYRRAEVPLADASVWQKIGATPMVGQNDTPADRFTLDDAAALLDYAGRRGIGRLSLWSLNRDIACGAQLDPNVVSDLCSGVRQQPMAFTTLFDSLGGRAAAAARSTTVTDTAPDPVDDPAQSPYPIWRDTKIYTKGDKVTWRHNVYEAKWWSQDDVPDEPVVNEWDTPWRLLGPVMPGDRPAPAATVADGTYVEWSPRTAYPKGERVQYEGVAYEAKWWTQDEKPTPEAYTDDPAAAVWRELDDDELPKAANN